MTSTPGWILQLDKNLVSLQRTENRFLPSNDARREKIQNRSSVQTDRERPPVLCRVLSLWRNS